MTQVVVIYAKYIILDGFAFVATIGEIPKHIIGSRCLVQNSGIGNEVVVSFFLYDSARSVVLSRAVEDALYDWFQVVQCTEKPIIAS